MTNAKIISEFNEIREDLNIRESKKLEIRPKSKESALKEFEYLNVGFYLVSPLLLGVFLGFQLDKFFKSKPLWIIAGIIFGVISTFYNLYKIIKKK